MKKWIAACFLPFILTACGSGEYVHSTEPRSTVYYGQPIADLYENFGTPTKAERTAENERVLIYLFQEIEKDWAYRYVRGCVMKFYLVNERVVDWMADGQACVIKSRTPKERAATATASTLTFSESDAMVPVDAFDGKAPTTYSPIRSATVPENTFRGKASDSISRSGQLPADAFDGKASATYSHSNAPFATPQRLSQLPADAFGGKASTAYTVQPQMQAGSMPSNSQYLPADAFDGKVVSGYVPVPQSRKTSYVPAQTKENSYDDEEWGLFD